MKKTLKKSRSYSRILGIDASRYRHDEPTGVEWYSFHLLNELIPLLGREHNTEVRLYSPRDFELKTEAAFNVKKRIIPMRRLWTVVRLSLEMLLQRPHILFIPSHTLPFFAPRRSVITIHDVAFRHFKECYTPFQYWLLNWSTRRAVKKGWKILVPSEATKKDLVELFACKGEKIVVVPHGAPELPKLLSWSSEETLSHLQRFQLSKDDLFILYVGRIETKKNLERVVEGFARFLQEFPGWKLVLAGKPGAGYEKIIAKIGELGLGDLVVLPGYVSEREKLFLLTACRMVAFPSLYEGFGLPVLEGFAMRRPVLTSKVSSLPEVGGNAAYFVDPRSPEEIGVGFKRLASDGMLVNQLILKGDIRVSQFTWEKAAKKTYEVLFT